MVCYATGAKGCMMHSKDMVDRAQEIAGTGAFSSRDFQTGLEILVGDLNRSKHLTARGRARLEQVFIGILVRRLKLDRYVAAHPEVLDVPVERPVVILG